MTRSVLTISLLSVFVVAVSLAPAVLLDRPWIAGLYDEADHDTAFLLILESESGPSSAGSGLGQPRREAGREASRGRGAIVASPDLSFEPLRGPPSL